MRRRLADWKPAIGEGAGTLSSLRPSVWKLDVEGRSYCVKAPKSCSASDAAILAGEANLTRELGSAGYPVPLVAWAEPRALLVTVWVEGPSLAEVLAAPRDESRRNAITQCVSGFAQMERASALFERHLGPAASPSADGVSEAILGAIGACLPHRRSDLTRLCDELARVICAPASTAGVADITPDDVVVTPSGAVFLDVGILASGWPERRFCQYFARGQQDPRDRAWQSALFLKCLGNEDSGLLDAHYLWHDLTHAAAWREAIRAREQSGQDRSIADRMLAMAMERIGWPGDCEVANDVRGLIRTDD